MHRTLCALAVLPALLAAAPASAEVIEIAPSSPWNVDYGETKCRLARFFGEGESKHLLFFEQYWPGERFGMTVAGPSFKRYRSGARTDLRFYEAQQPFETKPFSGTVGQFGDGVIYSTLGLAKDRDSGDEDAGAPTKVPELDKIAARQVEFVSLRQRGDEVRLLSGPLDEAFAVLDNCAFDLIGTWGLDVAQHRTATRLPRWINKDAVVRRIVAVYPREALNSGEQGIMRMRVTVSPEGTVEDCTIIKATDTERLESPACKAMMDARFEPALDAAGKPMRSYFAESIVYVM
jgi:TonB family protein